MNIEAEKIKDTFVNYRGADPAIRADSLKNLGRSEEIYTLLSEESRGLALISGLDAEETRFTLFALAHSFRTEGARVLSVRFKDQEQIPGIEELYTNSIAGIKHKLEILIQPDVIVMDSVDTEEKVVFALDHALRGTRVIAPVQAGSTWEAVLRILDAEYGEVSPEDLADVLVYVAHQDTYPNPNALLPRDEQNSVVATDIIVADEYWKERIISHVPSTLF